jgi:hypothetical protein
LTPQELRAEFEATFAGFVAQLGEITKQNEADKQKPRQRPTDNSLADLLGEALVAFEASSVTEEKPGSPHPPLYTRVTEFREVATHALALCGHSEHRCQLLRRTYTTTGAKAAHQHAKEILDLQQFVGLRVMVRTSQKLELLLRNNPEQFGANMRLILAAFPDRFTPVTQEIPTVATEPSLETLVANIRQHPTADQDRFLRTLDKMVRMREPMQGLGEIAFEALSLWRSGGSEQQCRDFLHRQFIPPGQQLGMPHFLFMCVRRYPIIREIFRGTASDLKTKLLLLVAEGKGLTALQNLPAAQPTLRGL